tara:strand:+ start:5013 stop:5339 length:327 start_codon:yes stop_codon:yes gene_type:complete
MSPSLIALGWVMLAMALDVVANVMLKYSQGFRRRVPALASLVCVLLAFTALAQAVRHLDLAVAYALWGGFGILATLTADAILFKQGLGIRGLLGIAVLMSGLILLKFG